MRITNYQPADFERVVAFLRAHWAPDHLLYDRSLFDWQYRGGRASLIVEDEGHVVGFLGNIPDRYLVDGVEHAAAGLTMWCVDEAYRNGGLGVRLIRATERACTVTLTLGANVAVLPMYRSMGYGVLPQLHRFALPLDPTGFQRLCPEPSPLPPVRRWPTAPLPTCGPATLAALFDRTVRPAFRLTRVRDADFWQWRYLDSVGYRYHLFGGDERGAVVARVEAVHAPDQPAVHGLRVLRLIELLPSQVTAWDGKTDEPFARLLAEVLGWAAGQGCVAADHQCASARAGHLLAPMGFGDRAWFRLAELFAPYRPAMPALNFVWKGAGDVTPDDCYVVKSDCDMDRPSMRPAGQPVWRLAC